MDSVSLCNSLYAWNLYIGERDVGAGEDQSHGPQDEAHTHRNII